MSYGRVMAKTKTWVLENFDNISPKNSSISFIQKFFKTNPNKSKNVALTLTQIYIYIYILNHGFTNPYTIKEGVRRVPNKQKG